MKIISDLVLMCNGETILQSVDVHSYMRVCMYEWL